jgi:carboxyl-terminal processing protease
LVFAVSAEAEPRVALVIGNSNYGDGIGKLPNPANDARLITSALQQTGFSVITVIDADQKRMKRAIADFGQKLTDAGPKATGLFYYAGHGIQVKGLNYLIPVDAHIEKEADVSIESLTADDVMEQMEFAANAVNIIILDACRNNPVARSMRSATRGLAPMRSDSVRGTFIAYSTAPGSTAADGTGANSPYSQALAKSIVQPGLGIEEIFRDVRGQVMAATDEQQIPWDSSSLTAPFYFSPGTAKPAAVTTAPAAAPVSAKADRDREETLWKYVENSKQPDDYQAYLDQYPNGTYAAVARRRLAGAETTAPSPQPAQPKPAAVAPTAATTPAPEPTPAPAAETGTDFGTQSESSGGGLFGSGPKIEYDSHGVDCRIMDMNRSETECRNTKKPKKANKPRG